MQSHKTHYYDLLSELNWYSVMAVATSLDEQDARGRLSKTLARQWPSGTGAYAFVTSDRLHCSDKATLQTARALAEQLGIKTEDKGLSLKLSRVGR